MVAFLRRARDLEQFVVCVCNFTPLPRLGYRIGVPRGGFYRELLNTDAEAYGGTNAANAGGVLAEAVPCHGHAHSLRLTVPPLAALVLRPEGQG